MVWRLIRDCEPGGEQETRNKRQKARVIKNYKDLEVYKLSYKLAMEIFWLSKKFPKEERYSLVSQIRNSSRLSLPMLGRVGQKEDMKTFLRGT